MGFEAYQKYHNLIQPVCTRHVPTVPVARGRLIWDILVLDLRSVDLYQDVH